LGNHSDQKLILIGPKTGIKGGANVSFNHLLDELDRRGIKYTCIDMPGGNYSLMRAFLLLKYVYLFARTIGRGSTISLHASDNSAMVYAFILDLFARKTESKLLIRIFGGQHLDHLQKQNRLLKKKLIECYSRNTLMLQTKSMVRRAEEEFEIEGVEWFPTSRPKTTPKNAGSFNLDGKLKLLYIGQVRETKGIDHLIKLAKMIKAQNLDIEIQLFGELFEERLKDEIDSLPDSVMQYGGVLESDYVYDEMRNADLLIFPTEYSGEGYPGVIIEAIHVQLPILASDRETIRDLIEDGVDGLLSEPNMFADYITTIEQNRTILLDYHKNLADKKEEFSSEYWNGEFFMELVKGKPQSAQRTQRW